MHVNYVDDDEYETVITTRPCTACGGDLHRCNGACNGYTGIGQRRRLPAEVMAIS